MAKFRHRLYGLAEGQTVSGGGLQSRNGESPPPSGEEPPLGGIILARTTAINKFLLVLMLLRVAIRRAMSPVT